MNGWEQPAPRKTAQHYVRQRLEQFVPDLFAKFAVKNHFCHERDQREVPLVPDQNRYTPCGHLVIMSGTRPINSCQSFWPILPEIITSAVSAQCHKRDQRAETDTPTAGGPSRSIHCADPLLRSVGRQHAFHALGNCPRNRAAGWLQTIYRPPQAVGSAERPSPSAGGSPPGNQEAHPEHSAQMAANSTDIQGHPDQEARHQGWHLGCG